MHLRWPALTSMRSHSYHEQGLGSCGPQPAIGKRGRGRSWVRQKVHIQFRQKKLGQQAVKPARSSQGLEQDSQRAEEHCVLQVLCVCLPQEPHSAWEHQLQDSAHLAPRDLVTSRSCTSQAATSPQRALAVRVCWTAHVPGQTPYHLSKSRDAQDWGHFS